MEVPFPPDCRACYFLGKLAVRLQGVVYRRVLPGSPDTVGEDVSRCVFVGQHLGRLGRSGIVDEDCRCHCVDLIATT